MGKFFEKVLANRLQFDATKYGALHPSQHGGTLGHCTEDAGVLLCHHILANRVKGLHTSCLAINVEQCFPLVNHSYLIRVLEHFGFSPVYIRFFRSYCRGMKQCDRFLPVTPPKKCDGDTVIHDRRTKVQHLRQNFGVIKGLGAKFGLP